jgi:hypothetical protein
MLAVGGALTGLLPEAEGPAAFAAWHGSGHLFEPRPGAPLGEFEPAKVGSGEGAQTEGWGLYTTRAQDAAQIYKEMGIDWGGPFGHDTVRFDGTPVTAEHMNPHNAILGNEAIGGINEFARSHGDVDDALRSLEDARMQGKGAADLIEAGGAPRERLGLYRDMETKSAAAHDWLSKNHQRLQFEEGTPPEGHIYQTWIHPEHEEFLDWDKTFEDQPKGVQEKLLQLYPEGAKDWFSGSRKKIAGMLNLDLKQLQRKWEPAESIKDWTGKQLYENLHDDPRTASEMLDAAGIPGNTYLDNSTENLSRKWHLDGQPWAPTVQDEGFGIVRLNGEPVVRDPNNLGKEADAQRIATMHYGIGQGSLDQARASLAQEAARHDAAAEKMPNFYKWENADKANRMRDALGWLNNNADKLSWEPWGGDIAGESGARKTLDYYDTTHSRGDSRDSIINDAKRDLATDFAEKKKEEANRVYRGQQSAEDLQRSLDWLNKHEHQLTLENNPREIRNYVIFHPRHISIIDRDGNRFGMEKTTTNPFTGEALSPAEQTRSAWPK